MLYYCVVAYRQLFTSDRFKFKTSILISYFSITAILYGHAIYDHSREGSADVVAHPNSYAAITNGVTHPKAVEMFNFIRNNTAQSDTIVFHKPRVMALLTQRVSAGDPVRKVQPAGAPGRKLHPGEIVNRFFDAVEGDYYVDYNGGIPLTHSEPPTSRFTEVFRNTHFAIYRYSQS
jgi:hypothetical protein